MTTAPAAGAAELTLAASSSPAPLRFPATTEMVARLEMRTDATPETFSVQIAPAGFFGIEDGSPVEGPPLRLTGEIALEGQATLGPLQSQTFGLLPACSRYPGGHGYGADGRGVDVSMPAQASASLIARFVPASAPWPETDYRVRFEASSELVGPPAGLLGGSGGGTLEGPQLALTPQPAVEGRRGVHIRFSVGPRPGVEAEDGGVPLGQRVLIAGTTDRPLARQVLTLRHLGPSDERFRTFGHVRTDRRGRFRFDRWAPRSPGRYEVVVVYRSRRRDISSDFSCGRPLGVVKRQQPRSAR